MISTFTFILFCVATAGMLVTWVWEWANEHEPKAGGLMVILVMWSFMAALGYHGWLWMWGS